MPDQPGDNEAARPATPHPDWNELARLADAGPDAVDPTILEHLAECPECQTAWAEAARYRGARHLQGDRYAIPEDLAAQARAMSPATSKVIKTSRRFWRPAPAFSAGGALLAAVLALFVLFPGLRGGDKALDRSQSLIFSHLEAQSGWGMVYPGATGGGDSGRPIYRSGDGIDSALLEALDSVEESWQADSADPETTWWLAAGYVSAGRLGLASDLIHQALRRNPGHVGLLHLQAITAWQLSEFDRAERALNEILIQAPADSVALFNLALVQIDTGRGQEAGPLLRSLAAGSTNFLLQERAREALAD